jgi:hypothetical protein
MAFSTGTATGGAAVLSAVSSFMQANGWTLFDSPQADDLVFSSAGSAGKATMYYRLTLSTSVDNPWKDPASPMKVAPQLFVRGYHSWNATTHVGTNEYGIMGPNIYAGYHVTGTSINAMSVTRIDSQVSGQPIPNTTTEYTIPSTSYPGSVTYPQSRTGRYLLCAVSNNTQFRLYDTITGEVVVTSVQPAGYNQLQVNTGAWTYDATADKWVYYYLPSSNAIAADAFWKYDIDLDTHTRNPVAPWSVNQGTGGGKVVWDGADTLYIILGVNGTLFYKYSISGGTYTSLTALPASRSSNYQCSNSNNACNTIYVPASVTGFSSDVIYTSITDNVSTTLYCYNTTTNSWNNTGAGTGNLTLPINMKTDSYLVWDGIKYAYFHARFISTAVYRMDLTNTAGGWSVFGSVAADLTSGYSQYYECMNFPVGRVNIAPSSTSTYWIFGTQDYINLVVKNPLGSNHYYWLHFGKSQTRRRSAIMTGTGSVSAGTNVSIAVDSSAAYAVGDKILCYDQANNKLESTTIYAIPDATHIQATVTNAYATGSYFASDPFQCVITGDCGIASAPTDPMGYKKDAESAWYLQHPSFSFYEHFNTGMDGMGYVQPTEPNLFIGNGTIQSLYRAGNYGTIQGFYYLPTRAYPAPQAEDTISVNGKTYYCFPMYSTQRLSSWPLNMVVGPTS